MVKSRFVQHGVIAQPHQIIMELLEARNENLFTEGPLKLFKARGILLIAALSVMGLLYKFAIPNLWEALAIIIVSYLLMSLALSFFKLYNQAIENKGIKSIFLVILALTLFIAILSLV